MTAELEYIPREQFQAFHNRNKRWSCVVAHRRSGKTVSAVYDLVMKAAVTTKKDARYAYVAPFYSQAKSIAWVYLKQAAAPLMDSEADIRESELCVRLNNGAWIRLYGADNINALRGIYLDGVVIDEYGDCRPSLWAEVLLPTLADRKGWGHFIGTAKMRNHFFDTAERAKNDPENWYFMELKASASGILPAQELAQLAAQMAPEQYARELECSFSAPLQGTFYADIIQQMELSGRINTGRARHDRADKVHIACDIGYTDSTAMWFWQHSPTGINIIDYEEHQGRPLSFYFTLIRDKNYKYGTIWLPHDARAKTLQTGRSTVEQFLNEDFPVRIAPNLKVQHGIEAVRYILPKCRINADTCKVGIEALRAYRRKFDEVNRVFLDKPLHDAASDGADSARYMALVCKESLPKEAPKSLVDPLKPAGFNLEMLYKDRDRVHGQHHRMRI